MSTFENDDLFGREKIASELTKMIDETNKPFSVAVDSYWGSGKSIFLLKWKNKLENIGYKTIYIDAWKMDYFVDPIVPIVGTLNNLLELENADYSDLKSALLVIMKDILKNVTKLDYDNILESFKNKSRLDSTEFINFEDQRNLIKKKLSEYSSKNGKVYFFIDELDRCKPLFAINFLERIKHFLDIPNFVFVFSIDLKQLGYSTKHVYGNIDTDAYFRKFFDIVYNLPSPSNKAYFEHLLLKNNFRNSANSEYLDKLKNLIEVNTHIGLRECEKIYEVARIANHNIVRESNNQYLFPYIILMKVLEPNLYKDFIRKEQDWNITKLQEWKLNIVYGQNSDYDHVVNLFSILGKVSKEDRIKMIKGTDFRQNEIYYSIADYAINYIEFGKTF